MNQHHDKTNFLQRFNFGLTKFKAKLRVKITKRVM